MSNNSNILKVFNPPESRDLSPSECTHCQILQTVVLTGGGAYFASNLPFRTKPGQRLPPAATQAWQGGVRGLGFAMMAFGIYNAWYFFSPKAPRA